MIATALTRGLGIEHPIVQAGMGNECTHVLAAAVSNAGGLGTLGTIGHPPDRVAEEIAACRKATSRPFAVNFATFGWAPFAMDMVDIAVAERVPVVSLSFGDPLPALEKCKAAGIVTMVQLQDLEGLRAAIRARPDYIIVQGNEAGGHTGRRGTLNFVAQALDMVGDIPVIAAGGIANGRGLAATLAMGCAGAVMGTRFKATTEYAGSDVQKEQIAASDGSNTVYDYILDEAYGMVWPNQVTGRALRSRFTEEWAGRREELRAKVASYPTFRFVAELAQSSETAINWAGESSGLVDSVKPAADVVRETVEQAERLLAGASELRRSPANA